MKGVSFCLKFLVLLIFGFEGKLLDGSPKHRPVLLKETYNEKVDSSNFDSQLDNVSGRLQDFYKEFQDVRTETFNKIDSLTSMLSSRKSIDDLKKFVQDKLNKNAFESRIKAALEEKFQSMKEKEIIDNKLSEIENIKPKQEVLNKETDVVKTLEDKGLEGLSQNRRELTSGNNNLIELKGKGMDDNNKESNGFLKDDNLKGDKQNKMKIEKVNNNHQKMRKI